MSELKFKFSLDKLINAIAFFSCLGIRDLTKLKVAKLLYFADKDHLLRFGRPIIGDEYFCLPYGPIPSVSLNEMNDALNSTDLEEIEEIDSDAICFASTLKIHRPFFGYPSFRARTTFDQDVFSKSEIESLTRVATRLGSKTASELVSMTHKEMAWLIPNMNRKEWGRARIPYELFFHGAGEEAQELLEFIKEEQREKSAFEASLCEAEMERERIDAESGPRRTPVHTAI